MCFRTVLIKCLSCIFFTILLFLFTDKEPVEIKFLLALTFPFILQFFWELMWAGLFKFKSAIAMYIYNLFGIDTVILLFEAIFLDTTFKILFFIVLILKGIFCLYYRISDDKKQKP